MCSTCLCKSENSTYPVGSMYVYPGQMVKYSYLMEDRIDLTSALHIWLYARICAFSPYYRIMQIVYGHAYAWSCIYVALPCYIINTIFNDTLAGILYEEWFKINFSHNIVNIFVVITQKLI